MDGRLRSVVGAKVGEEVARVYGEADRCRVVMEGVTGACERTSPPVLR